MGWQHTHTHNSSPHLAALTEFVIFPASFSGTRLRGGGETYLVSEQFQERRVSPRVYPGGFLRVEEAFPARSAVGSGRLSVLVTQFPPPGICCALVFRWWKRDPACYIWASVLSFLSVPSAAPPEGPPEGHRDVYSYVAPGFLIPSARSAQSTILKQTRTK